MFQVYGRLCNHVNAVLLEQNQSFINRWGKEIALNFSVLSNCKYRYHCIHMLLLINVQAAQWCLQLSGVCSSVVFVAQWCLQLSGVCSSVVLAAQWCLQLSGVCSSVVFVAQWCFQLSGVSSSVVYQWCV